MKKEELKQVHEALSLLNSMVNGGEQHSKQSIEITQKAFQIVKNLDTSDIKHCACSVEETTGWTKVKCCNICGKPLKEENWH